jgi:hypothetical protein
MERRRLAGVFRCAHGEGIVWQQMAGDDPGRMRQPGLIPDTLPADKPFAPARK